MNEVEHRWIGNIPYLKAERIQVEHRDLILAGARKEVVFGAIHPPVYVSGVRTPPDGDILTELRQTGVPLVRSKRGGLVTYHGPGQLMIYCLIDVRRRNWTIPAFVCKLEQAVINWLESIGIEGHRVDGAPGIWVDDQKICALGLHFKRWVSMYGLALNLYPEKERTDLIRPCGYDPSKLTSMVELTGTSWEADRVWNDVTSRLIGNIRMKCVDSMYSNG